MLRYFYFAFAIIEKTFRKSAEKSSKYLLLPIGADHLDIETDITEQIKQVNNLLTDYEIVLNFTFLK